MQQAMFLLKLAPDIPVGAKTKRQLWYMRKVCSWGESSVHNLGGGDLGQLAHSLLGGSCLRSIACVAYAAYA